MKAHLVEGVDYIMENHRMVFTKDFLLKRGYCCNSKCRNCPYKKHEENKKRFIDDFTVKCLEET